MTAVRQPPPARSITLGGTAYPLYLPSLRDPRLHVAAVIITIHVLGQVGLHFRVSVPQILAAILTTAVIEVVLTFRSSRAFVWPASAMLTGSGVALILRVVGTPPDDPWNTYGWYVFAGVAAFSLLTKYVIKYRGSHVFNPSNIGLVIAFIVLGETRIEPLDFWWAPLTNPLMVIAYVVIIGGGLLITRRLHLLALAATFWVTLAIGVGLLAASGHSMVANWAFAPVSGFDFWRVIVTSPEVMIFLFFMITDPKTVPAGRVGRVIFGLLVAVMSTLLMAPQTNEFGTKVGLLAGLVVVCAARPILDRLLPEPRSTSDEIGQFARRVALGGNAGLVRGLAGVGLTLGLVLVLGVGIVAAGTPARGAVAPDVNEVFDRVPHQVDASTFPAITVGQDVTDWDHAIAGPAAQDIVLTLAENLELENQALLRRDPTILPAVDHGDRLDEMQARLAEATTAGATTVERYRFDSIAMRLITPFGKQSGLSLGLDATGTLVEETYDANGRLVSSTEAPFARTFAVRRATGDRWLNVGVLAAGGS
jgi:Na+-translocating ferredoxin:NAD+ oxidoreductase RnfD subunit